MNLAPALPLMFPSIPRRFAFKSRRYIAVAITTASIFCSADTTLPTIQADTAAVISEQVCRAISAYFANFYLQAGPIRQPIAQVANDPGSNHSATGFLQFGREDSCYSLSKLAGTLALRYEVSMPVALNSSMRPLADAEMRKVSGRGVISLKESASVFNGQFLSPSPFATLSGNTIFQPESNSSNSNTLGDLSLLLNPLSLLFDAQISMKDVVYSGSNVFPTFNPDGSVTLNIPSSIGELSIQNIRIQGVQNSNLGSIQMNNIDLSGTTVRVTPSSH